jgi:hypothetical protein
MPITTNTSVAGAGVTVGKGVDELDDETEKPPLLSVYRLSATVNVMVGFATEKFENPRALSDVAGSVNELGGDELPRPSATFAANSCTEPTPEIVMMSDPKFQDPVNPPMLPENEVAAPTGELPATVRTPDAFVQ